jgi:large subunit ribosomal protein L10
MGVSLEHKQRMVQEVASVAKEAHAALAADYRGLTALEMDRLRVNAREQGVYLRVIKNTLARQAVSGTDFECMTSGFQGPLMLAFSMEDPGAAARVLKEYAKGNDRLEVKMVAVGGQVFPPSEIDRLAELPTYDEAISRLMATMRQPVEKVAQGLNEVPSKLVRALSAVKDAKG